MASQEVQEVLNALQSPGTLPRIEIGETSVVYRVRDGREDGPYVTEFDTEYLTLERATLEQLADSALQSLRGRATAQVNAMRTVHQERWDDFLSAHEGSPAETNEVPVKLQLTLRKLCLIPIKPVLSIEY